MEAKPEEAQPDESQPLANEKNDDLVMMETTFEEEKKDMSDDDEVPDDEDSVDQVDGNSSLNQDSFSRSGVQRSVVMT